MTRKCITSIVLLFVLLSGGYCIIEASGNSKNGERGSREHQNANHNDVQVERSLSGMTMMMPGDRVSALDRKNVICSEYFRCIYVSVIILLLLIYRILIPIFFRRPSGGIFLQQTIVSKILFTEKPAAGEKFWHFNVCFEIFLIDFEHFWKIFIEILYIGFFGWDIFAKILYTHLG